MKQKVVILYGGPSSEHEVSVNSAKNVLEHIDRNVYEPIDVFISKEGVFLIDGSTYNTQSAIKKIKTMADIVFPVLHGTFGEDGKLQALLEDEKILFVGSGSSSSHIAIDKDASNRLFAENGVLIPRSQLINRNNNKVSITFPIILKPLQEGSSIGLLKCQSEEEFETMLSSIFNKYNEMLAQEFITGREFTCGVVDISGETVALPATEVILKAGLFDYNAKYTAGECVEITPAHVSPELMKQLQDTAMKCHEILGCKSISRTDMILSQDGKLYVLETNTLPGMTKTSFIPAQAEAYGLSMKELISQLISSAKF